MEEARKEQLRAEEESRKAIKREELALEDIIRTNTVTKSLQIIGLDEEKGILALNVPMYLLEMMTWIIVKIMCLKIALKLAEITILIP